MSRTTKEIKQTTIDSLYITVNKNRNESESLLKIRPHQNPLFYPIMNAAPSSEMKGKAEREEDRKVCNARKEE
jgi:hypothetical protein